MHRQMIADVNAILTRVGDPNYLQVQGWLVPPPPDDPSYPVPPAWFDPGNQAQVPFSNLERIKSDVFYEKRFRFWQDAFTDPVFLRSVTLGQLGVVIEMTIHNTMHMRWAAALGSARPDPLQATGDVDPTKGEMIDLKWDDPRYDFLGDTYSSHVNPIFWKLHGWIDDRVTRWKLANGVFGDNFWKGTWGRENAGPRTGSHGTRANRGTRAMQSTILLNCIKLLILLLKAASSITIHLCQLFQLKGGKERAMLIQIGWQGEKNLESENLR